MFSAAIGILGGYFIIREMFDRYGTGYDQLVHSNQTLKECSDSLAVINDEVMDQIKTFKDRILFVIIFSFIILVINIFRSVLTFICILSNEFQEEMKKIHQGMFKK